MWPIKNMIIINKKKTSGIWGDYYTTCTVEHEVHTITLDHIALQTPPMLIGPILSFLSQSLTRGWQWVAILILTFIVRQRQLMISSLAVYVCQYACYFTLHNSPCLVDMVTVWVNLHKKPFVIILSLNEQEQHIRKKYL